MYLQDVNDYSSAVLDDDTWRIPVVLGGARCTGSEATLADCPGVNLEPEPVPCDLTDEVVIACVNDVDAGAKLLQMHCKICCMDGLRLVLASSESRNVACAWVSMLCSIYHALVVGRRAQSYVTIPDIQVSFLCGRPKNAAKLSDTALHADNSAVMH